MLRGHGVPCDETDLHVRPPYEPAVAEWDGATLIHPGAAARARRWPPDRFGAVAAGERSKGRTVVVTGSAGERGIAMEVAATAGLPAEAVLAGRLDLAQLASLVAQVGRVVCGDTGVAHLATSCRTPSVVLFGPVPPSEWGPPPNPRHIALWKGVRGDPHGRAPDAGLLRIGVDEVFSALSDLDRFSPVPAGPVPAGPVPTGPVPTGQVPPRMCSEGSPAPR